MVELSQASPHDISNVLKLYLRQVRCPQELTLHNQAWLCWVGGVLPQTGLNISPLCDGGGREAPPGWEAIGAASCLPTEIRTQKYKTLPPLRNWGTRQAKGKRPSKGHSARRGRGPAHFSPAALPAASPGLCPPDVGRTQSSAQTARATSSKGPPQGRRGGSRFSLAAASPLHAPCCVSGGLAARCQSSAPPARCSAQGSSLGSPPRGREGQALSCFCGFSREEKAECRERKERAVSLSPTSRYMAEKSI